MNGLDLRRVLLGNVHTRRVFKGVFPRDDLPHTINKTVQSAFIINTDKRRGKGEHWVVVYFDGFGSGYYFDSYGLDVLHNEIQDFIDANSISYIYNKRVLQGIFSTTCGYYCAYFVLQKAKGCSFKDALSVFSPFNPRLNDRRVIQLYKSGFKLY